MTLKDDIQGDIVDENIGLSTVLRKAAILAHRLNSEDFKQWVKSELNGYKGEPEDLPDYRRLGTQSYGHFAGPFGSGINNAPIPTAHLPKEIQEYASSLPLFQSVKELEAIIGGTEEYLRMPWPPDLTVVIAKEIYKDMVCMQAWKSLSIAQVQGVLETVRNRLLDFLLQLEDIDPAFSEASANGGSLQPDTVSQVFNNFIMGSHNIVGSGYSVTQSSTQVISEGDFDALAKELRSWGVEDEDVAELEVAIEVDGVRTKEEGFGPRAKKWIARMVNKIAEGVWDMAIETGPVLLSKALSAYYGWN